MHVAREKAAGKRETGDEDDASPSAATMTG